jgi:hypothetical protein
MHELKEDELITILNKMICACKPFKYQDINYYIPQKDNQLVELEKEIPEVGLAKPNYSMDQEFGTSTIAIMATITDIFCGKRLAWQIAENGDIVGVQWYVPNNK